MQTLLNELNACLFKIRKGITHTTSLNKVELTDNVRIVWPGGHVEASRVNAMKAMKSTKSLFGFNFFYHC